MFNRKSQTGPTGKNQLRNTNHAGIIDPVRLQTASVFEGGEEYLGGAEFVARAQNSIQ